MCEEYKNLLVKYLGQSNVYAGEEKWEITENPQYGRCLVAKKDLDKDEVIFSDRALFYGPRGHNYEKVRLKLSALQSFLIFVCF